MSYIHLLKVHLAPLVQLGPSQPGVTVGLNQAGHECILSLVPDGGQVTSGDGERRRLGWVIGITD